VRRGRDLGGVPLRLPEEGEQEERQGEDPACTRKLVLKARMAYCESRLEAINA